MKKFLIPCLLTAIFLLSFIRTNEQSSVAVHFSPTGRDRLLTKTILQSIEQAEHDVRIAMYQFTSYKLAEGLVSVHKTKKVSIRILVDARSFEIRGEENRALKLLMDQGIQVKKVVLKGDKKTDEESPRFHHKFCVIDQKTVLTGSYNWTALGDESNYENLVVIQSEPAAAAYVKEFERIWNDTNITR